MMKMTATVLAASLMLALGTHAARAASEGDMTPTDYLRRRRLEGAHAEMQAGSAASVGEIALRWGFASASRFAKHYRDAYGRTPRQTLRGG